MGTKKTKKDKEKKPQIDLRLEVKNFGPISKADVEIKPLTMFIGPNNSGKSYLALLIHSVFSISDFSNNFLYNSSIKYRDKDVSKFIDNLNMESKNDIILPDNMVRIFIENLFKELYSSNYEGLLSGLFSSSLKDLIQINNSSFSMKISKSKINTTLSYRNNEKKLRINNSLKLVPKIIFKYFEDKLSYKSNGDEILFNLNAARNNIHFYFNIAIRAFFYRSFPLSTYYLPAARSGLMQGHKTIVADAIYNASFAGIKDSEEPKFSGAVAEFLSNLIKLPEKKGHFYDLALEFEQELIHGEIKLSSSDRPYPEIKYKFNDFEIPLQRASSTVSEMAPLFLYLKYLIKTRDVLIIEEPESHLDLRNQTILAKYLVRLIRGGVYIIITTHSEYLFSQINNLLLLSKIKPEDRVTKYGYKKDDYLNPDELSAYVFKEDKKSGGFKTEKIKIYEDGVMEDEFLYIHESLYDEYFELQQDSDK